MCKDKKPMQWIGSELSDSPWFDDTWPVDKFLVQMEKIVPTKKILYSIYSLVRGTYAQWWVTHCPNIQTLAHVVEFIKV
jgi:hypothetical protein